MEGGLAVARDPVQDLLVRVHRRSRGHLSRVERIERRLVEDPAGDADGLYPLPAVLLRGQVVEPQRGVDHRVGARDLDRAPCVRVHRPDVDLVPVIARGRRAVVPDGERQEVEHEVGVGNILVAPGEPATLEVIGRPGAAAEEQPLESDPGPAPLLERGLHRHWLPGAVLDVDLEVVLEVLTNARKIVHDVDPERSQLIGVAHAG